MFLENFVTNVNLFFLILVRIFAMLAVSPLFSSEAIPDVARAGLAFFTAVVIFPWVQAAGYPIPENGLAYLGLLVGEVLLGLLQGFFLVLIFSVFQMAGQFFAQQMGFSASEVYDPLAQVELPVLGQFLNLIAMMVFISIGGLHQIFLVNVWESFKALKAVDFIGHQGFVNQELIGALAMMFQKSFLLSLPVFGVLLLVSVTLGLIGKAAPQMNLMMMGFPISIGLGFTLMILGMPFLIEAFSAVINGGFNELAQMMDRMKPPPGVIR